MTSAARAYEYQKGSGARKLQKQPVRVVEPHKRTSISSGFSKFTRYALLIGLFIGLILFARLGLQSLTVGVMMENDQVNEQIEQVRTESVNLEVEKSTAGNPTNLKKEATKLGMGNPYYTETLELEEDVVAYDEDGKLSLSDSLAVASGK